MAAEHLRRIDALVFALAFVQVEAQVFQSRKREFLPQILGAIVIRHDAEDLREVPGFAEAENEWGPSGDVHWGNFGLDGWILWSQGFVSVPFTVEEAGDYIVSVTAWAQQAGPEPARMIVTVDGTTPWSGSAGEITIRQKLVELHELLLGETQQPDDDAIGAAYDLLVETWQVRNQRWPGGNSIWYWPDDPLQLPARVGPPPMMRRRQFIQSLALATGSSLLGGPFNKLYAAPADYEGHLLLVLQAEGGWDVTSLCDPKTNTPGE